MDEVLKVELNQVVEDQDALGEAIHPRKNLKDTHMKIWENVKSKMAKYLDTLFEVPSAEK